MSSLIGLLIGTLLASRQTGTTDSNNISGCPKILLEVCLSPGCVSDGGYATLRKLQALAPPDRLTVKAGTCMSACGNGPVVRQDEKIIHKRVGLVGKQNNDFLESLLLGEPLPKELVKGYELVCDAEVALEEEQYDDAIDLYERGILSAIEISTSRAKEEEEVSPPLDEIDNNNVEDRISSPSAPTSLQWLITAYQSLARAKLQVKDQTGALEAAEKACEMAKGSDPVCWELVATIYEALQDTKGEMKALQALFALPVEENKLPQNVRNRRRTLGFRLAKLERETSN